MDLFLFSSRGPCRFGCDTLISGCQWGEIAENGEGFGAKAKKETPKKVLMTMWFMWLIIGCGMVRQILMMIGAVGLAMEFTFMGRKLLELRNTREMVA